MEIVDLIAEGEKVVGRFRCSGTHLGPWRGRPPTGRRFERVDEVYIFRVKNGRISEAGVGDRGRPLTRAATRALALAIREIRDTTTSGHRTFEGICALRPS
jgi:hypothetical protein